MYAYSEFFSIIPTAVNFTKTVLYKKNTAPTLLCKFDWSSILVEL